MTLPAHLLKKKAMLHKMCRFGIHRRVPAESRNSASQHSTRTRVSPPLTETVLDLPQSILTGISQMQPDNHDSRLFDELHQIRTELQALRKDFEKRGLESQFEAHVNELEIEERLRQIQDEITEEGKPPQKRGWFRRK